METECNYNIQSKVKVRETKQEKINAAFLTEIAERFASLLKKKVYCFYGAVSRPLGRSKSFALLELEDQVIEEVNTRVNIELLETAGKVLFNISEEWTMWISEDIDQHETWAKSFRGEKSMAA